MNRQPVRVHQFHYTASNADAVTNQMLFIREALKKVGVGGEIFVGLNGAPASHGISDFAPGRLWDSDLILVHHSHGNPLLKDVLRLDIPKAIVYHNITPPGFFLHDTHMSRFSDQGRNQLKAFRDEVVAAFGVSRYNCAELEALGLPHPTVFPLLDCAPYARPIRHRSSTKTPRTLLFVGKITPHKNQALLVQTLFYLNHIYPGKYRLILAGRKDPVYAEYIRLLAKALGVSRSLSFAGTLSSQKLEELFQSASALVCPSLHEGFCIPLVEGMQHQIPVFALPTTGVRETLGQAGVRLVTRLPHKIAEVIDAVLDDSDAVKRLIELQNTRLEELAQLHNPERVQTLVLEIVDKLRQGSRPSITMPEVYT